LKDCLLKDAAKSLGINYSTAKTILRIFRIEKRIEKKNADEERELKDIIFNFQNNKNIKKSEILKTTKGEEEDITFNGKKKKKGIYFYNIKFYPFLISST
jgi:hypothetical protein